MEKLLKFEILHNIARNDTIGNPKNIIALPIEQIGTFIEIFGGGAKQIRVRVIYSTLGITMKYLRFGKVAKYLRNGLNKAWK